MLGNIAREPMGGALVGYPWCVCSGPVSRKCIVFSLANRTQVRPGIADSSPQQTGTSRTVKRYPSSTWPITSNALPSGKGSRSGHGQSSPRASSDRRLQGQSNALSPAGNDPEHHCPGMALWRICRLLFKHTTHRNTLVCVCHLSLNTYPTLREPPTHTHNTRNTIFELLIPPI